jgi:hypothetical protein
MAIEKFGTHAVGNLNSRHVVTIPEVMAKEALENYSLVEFVYEGGVRKAQPLSDATKKGFLACAVEILYGNEPMKEFYIGAGEYFRTIHAETGVRFETSGFVQITAVAPAVGQYASWDATAKKFQLEAVASATSAQVFQVVDVLNGEYGFGLPMVRLETVK